MNFFILMIGIKQMHFVRWYVIALFLPLQKNEKNVQFLQKIHILPSLQPLKAFCILKARQDKNQGKISWPWANAISNNFDVLANWQRQSKSIGLQYFIYESNKYTARLLRLIMNHWIYLDQRFAQKISKRRLFQEKKSCSWIANMGPKPHKNYFWKKHLNKYGR